MRLRRQTITSPYIESMCRVKKRRVGAAGNLDCRGVFVDGVSWPRGCPLRACERESRRAFDTARARRRGESASWPRRRPGSRRPGLFTLALLGLLVAAHATCAAQEPTEASAVPKDGLERRQALPPSPATVSINGALRGGVQWILDPPRGRDDPFGFGALDAVLSLRPSPNITALVDVEALAGPGPDQVLGTLSRVNAESERLQEDHDKRLWLREAWLRFQFLEGHVRFNIGKLDVTHYFDRNFFAEDETRQFLAGALLGDPMLRPPSNGPGASLRISQGDWRYALGVHGPGDFNEDLSGLPYVIFELGRRDILPLSGHYRWWTRVGSVPERRKAVTVGTGVN